MTWKRAGTFGCRCSLGCYVKYHVDFVSSTEAAVEAFQGKLPVAKETTTAMCNRIRSSLVVV
jgi:hypothetical protein